jgi:nucleoside-diphosphate-sugar epimerase
MNGSSSRILVTGAGGLIGHALVQELSSHSQVVALVHTAVPDFPDGVELLEHDLRQEDMPHLSDAPETIVHLAQSPRYREFPNEASDVFEVNVAATHRLLNWAQRTGVRRFVYASSGGIYGHGDSAFIEDTPLSPVRPLGHYLTTKHCAELLVETFGSIFTVVILRFFFVYGRRQRRSMLMPRLVDSVIQGRPILLQGEEGLRLNPIHVSDAADAVAAATQLRKNQKINVAGPEVFTLREIGDLIGDLVGRSPNFEHQCDTEAYHLVGSIDKMSRLLTPPRVDLARGIKDLLPDVENQGAGDAQ